MLLPLFIFFTSKGANMAIVSRHYWKPTDIDKFVKCHGEFHDNHLKNAGAVDMKLYKHDSKDIYIADVIFDSWSGKDKWEEYFKTNTSVQEFGKRINETAESVNKKEYLHIIDY